jgi:hypothetical protein
MSVAAKVVLRNIVRNKKDNIRSLSTHRQRGADKEKKVDEG